MVISGTPKKKKVKSGEEEIDQASFFRYLNSHIREDASCAPNIKDRITTCKKPFYRRRQLMCSKLNK